MNQDTLSKRISAKKSLSESEIDSLVDILGKYCQARTKRILVHALSAVPDIKGYGIYERVQLTDGKAHYCAGQSYPDEIRTVRELLLNWSVR